MEQPRGRRVARWLGVPPVAVLVVVALLQMTLAHTVGLSPWKGGGFGMFSTVDSPDYRMVIVTVRLQGNEGRVPLRDLVEGVGPEPLNRVVAMPDDGAVRRVADSVLQRRWEIDSGRAMLNSEGKVPESVTVGVEALRVDPEDRQRLGRQSIGELSVSKAGQG